MSERLPTSRPTSRELKLFARVRGIEQRDAEADRQLACDLAEGDAEIVRRVCHGLELVDLDAPDMRFEQVVFANCSFERVDFSGSTLTDVMFRGCRFISCAFERCWLNRVDFRSCSAPGLRMAKSRFTGISFDDCQLGYADISDANVKQLVARATSFAESTWYATKLSRVTLGRCDLTRAEFIRTPLAGIDVSSCDIAGIVVSSDHRELRECLIAPEQAADIVGLLGVRFVDEDD